MKKIILLTVVLISILACSDNKAEDLRRLRFEMAQVESRLSEIRYTQMENIQIMESLARNPEEQDLEESVLQNILELNSYEIELIYKKDSIQLEIDLLLGYTPDANGGIDSLEQFFEIDTLNLGEDSDSIAI